MAKIDYNNLREALELNNEWLKQYVYDVITNFSPTSVNVARILSHLTNTTIHVTPEDKELWDSSYTKAKEYTDGKFAEMSSLELKVVGKLPTENILKNAIYLLETDTVDVYDQYVYSDGQWVPLGSTSVDMSMFYTRDQIDAIVKELKSTAQHDHANKAILDLVTAAFTVEEKQLLTQLNTLDVTGLSNHLKDTNSHMTSEERSILNKLKEFDVDSTTAHIENNTIHLTAEDKERYDNILAEAKKYTNSSIENLMVYEKVESLPEEPDTSTMYLIPAANPTLNHMYDKYIYVEGNWELIGGGEGSSTSGIDFSMFVTTSVMQEYVNQRTHSHANKAILDQTTAAFTEEIYQIISSVQSTAMSAIEHMKNNNIHLTDTQVQLIENIKTIDNKINTAISDAISKLENDGDLGLKVIYVDSLPTNLSSVDRKAIYFVPISSPPEDVLEDNADITSVDQTVNYNKYMWSSEFNCWEIFNGTSMEITDEEIEEILSGV